MPLGFPNYKMLDHAKTKRVIFLDPQPYHFIKYERAIVKYIKYSHENVIYYAKDEMESWQLNFKDIDQENETLVGTKRPDLLLHKCLQNMLIIEKVYFCFYKKVCVF